MSHKINMQGREEPAHFVNKVKENRVMGKKLVAYFSAGGTTKKVAEMIAESAGAELFEIEPKVAYTKADLNWMDKKSRSSVEMNDKKFRPEIVNTAIDVNAYDEIILGV